jgi:hypothetical protein
MNISSVAQAHSSVSREAVLSQFSSTVSALTRSQDAYSLNHRHTLHMDRQRPGTLQVARNTHMCTLCNHADKPPDSFARLSVNRSYLDEFWSYVYVREPAPYANSTNNTNIESPLWSKPGAPMYIPVLPEEETYRALMKAWPQTTQDILTVNHRCGRDAWNTSLRVMPTGGYKVFTRDVLAGDELSFLPERYSVGDQHYDYIGHVGPGMVYLAKKPDGVTLTEWDGDGDWFKIDYRGPKDNVTWSLFHEKSYTCM